MFRKKKLFVRDVANALEIDCEFLTFRPAGRQAKEYVLNYISDFASNDILDLDFSGVRLCDISFIDEIVLELQMTLRDGKELMFFVSNANDGIIELLEAAQSIKKEKRGIRVPVLLEDNNGEIYCQGTLEKNLKETLRFINDHKEVTARDVAEYYDIAINNASNRLKKLYDQRIIARREIVDQNGKQHIYMALKV